MLADMDAGQLVEWMAFFKMESDEYKREGLKARAESSLQSHRRGGR